MNFILLAMVVLSVPQIFRFLFSKPELINFGSTLSMANRVVNSWESADNFDSAGVMQTMPFELSLIHI